MIPTAAAIAASRFGRGTLLGMLTRDRAADLATLRDLIEAGRVTPAVERTYPLHDVPEALRYVGAGHARAKIVITT